jgi:hypothetical protein
MNRDTFPGTNPYACTSALADDLTDRIALAGHPAEIDGIIRDAWCRHTHGRLTEDEVAALDEAARMRREALQPRRAETPPRLSTPLKGAPRWPVRRRQRSPDRQASIERRRRLVATGPLPPPMAARFTWGEQAVMRIVGDECRDHGECRLHIDAIAARAGVERTTVQNALREAQGKGDQPGAPIVRVTERRRPGRPSLTNVIHIISREWRDWLHRGPRHASRAPRGEGSKSSTRPIRVGSFREDRPQKGPPWGIPDGVFSCEEVA